MTPPVKLTMRSTALLVMGMLALGLAGCGKKGAPRAEPGAIAPYPRVYPDPGSMSTDPAERAKPSTPTQAPPPPAMGGQNE